jgi:GH24 family phage-related lysozyme (muramidase)
MVVRQRRKVSLLPTTDQLERRDLLTVFFQEAEVQAAGNANDNLTKTTAPYLHSNSGSPPPAIDASWSESVIDPASDSTATDSILYHSSVSSSVNNVSTGTTHLAASLDWNAVRGATAGGHYLNDWTLGFTADTSTTMYLTYNLSSNVASTLASGHLSHNFDYVFSDSSGNHYGTFTDDGSGSSTIPIIAGNSYVFHARLQSVWKSTNIYGTHMSDDFTFTWQLGASQQPLPSVLTASIDPSMQGIHKLLYPGQNLAVPLIVKDAGSTASIGNVNIAYYLSANQETSVTGDTALQPANDQSLNIAAGKTQTITSNVTIPTNTKVGTYYIKAVISPGSQNPISLANGNLLAVSPTLNEIDAAIKMLTPNISTGYSRADSYEAGVGLAKSSPNYASVAFPNNDFSDAKIQAYIKSNEGWEDGPYLDSRNYPTIGWGFNLLADPNLAEKELGALDFAMKSINKSGIGLVDPTTNNPFDLEYGGNLYTGFVAVAKANGVISTAHPLKWHIAGFTQTAPSVVDWFSQLYTNLTKSNTASLLKTYYHITLTSLPGNVQAVLLDMSYNIGTGYIQGTDPAKIFKNMITYIGAGSYGAAGFELLNSDYGTQFPLNKAKDYSILRSVRNFRILISGREQNL